jgi:hypothetical protein
VSNRTLLIIGAVLIGGWLLLRQQGPSQLPWNVGQAGSIFSGLRGGGGQ